MLLEATPDLEAATQRLRDAVAGISSAYAAFQQVSQRVNSYVAPARHRVDDPALQQLAVAADRVANRGIEAPVPMPASMPASATEAVAS